MNNRRLIVEKIKILTEEIEELESSGIYLDEDDYIEAQWTVKRIQNCNKEIKELNKEIKEF